MKVRKIRGFIVATLVFTFLSSRIYAQEYYIENPNTFFGGPVLGVNFTQVDGDNYAGYHKIGMNVGGIVYSRFSDMFAASMEILYAQKGSRSTTVKGSSSKAFDIQNYRIDMNYAEIPFMIHIFDKRRSHAGVGFSYSQLVGAKESVTTTNQKFNDTAQTYFDRFPFKKSDINLVLGVNLRLYKGFYLNLKFQYSLAPVRKTDLTKFGEFGREEQFNNSYSMRLVYLFGQKYGRKTD